MALLRPLGSHQIGHNNKEPEWSRICNNVFDQYLDDDDLFGFDANQRGRSSSDESANLFDFSGASEQSHQTDATSPIPPWDPLVHDNIVEAQQPKAKEPVNFWTKTLRALEQNAAECEKQQNLRSTKSHPDFLSLGGCPSPPAVPGSPTDQSFPAQRRVSRQAANGKRRNVTARSVSRGRPSGVVKSAATGPALNYASVRRCSASPPKMMNPSRYRAGFKDVWADKLQSSPGKYELRVPPSGIPASPPPSARSMYEDDMAAFGSSSVYPPLPQYDDQISPLTNTFSQAHIHTPILSPAINAAAHTSNAYLTSAHYLPAGGYNANQLPVEDTAPLYPERTTSLAPQKIPDFDFGFSSPPAAEAWSAGLIHDPILSSFSNSLDVHDAFGPFDGGTVMPSIETANMGIAGLPGLGISCDPSLVSGLHHNAHLPANPYTQAPTSHPRTPHRFRSKSRHRSLSPSPTPATEPRSSKRASSSRRTSRHRRAKSTTATPRQTQGLGGFVNYTPQDSTKILNGVAPSGSSKTKMRREQEAAEKRRRLSQAAVKAVVEAGGDLKALGKAGLLYKEQQEDEEDSLFVT